MNYTSSEIAKKIAGLLDDKKAENVELLHVVELTSLAEYFVICNGMSSTHVRALADEVEMQLSKMGIEPHHVEGNRGESWILMDYDSVIVHIFYKEMRDFYNLERLWSDAEKVDFLTSNSPKGSDEE